MAFRIVFNQRINPNELPEPQWSRPWLYPQFDIWEGEHPFLVNVRVSREPAVDIYGDREEEFKQALLQYVIRKLEDALRSESLLISSHERLQEIHIGGADLPFIEKFLCEKICSYQIKEGGNLFCSAGTLEDYRKGSNLPNRAVTSRAICRQCDLPDASFICSNLSHPAIMARQVMGGTVLTSCCRGSLR